MQVIERLDCGKMRVWDVYINDIQYIGVVKFNTESENISFKIRSEYAHKHTRTINALIKIMVDAMNVVKNQIVDEVLLGE